MKQLRAAAMGILVGLALMAVAHMSQPVQARPAVVAFS